MSEYAYEGLRRAACDEMVGMNTILCQSLNQGA